MNYFEELVEKKLLDTHTAFIGKVVSYSSGEAKIQPLTIMKQMVGKTLKQAVIPDVPVLQHAQHKLSVRSDGTVSASRLAAGDVVLCVCAERDITDAIRGISSVPPVGRHQIKDAVVVGVIA